jgi:2-oxoglutarate ferredoxin oxidoreductase subunit beta
MAETNVKVSLKPKDFKGKVSPDWCPGCGDFGVLSGLQRAVSELGLQPHEILTISGIGCSSNFPGFFNSYGMHTLHGRSLPHATGAKLANHEMNVIVTGGDGDGYGIGGNHFTHTSRRNLDVLYIVMDNQIYGLTTGQISPTSEAGMKTKSTPYGSIELPINPIASAITAGATWVARGYTGNIKQLTRLMIEGIQHKGFALLDVFSPCVTFNKVNTYQFFRPRVQPLEDIDHDTRDWKTGIEKAMLWGDVIHTGVFFETNARMTLGDQEPVLDDGGPLAFRELGLDSEQTDRILSRMM